MSDSPGTVMTTSINRGWLTKMVIIALFMIGFGLWGLYDALKAYPARGERAASLFQYEYLSKLDARGDGSLLSKATVADPVAEYTRLSEGMQSGTGLTAEDAPKLSWLEQLKLIGHLKPEYTTVTDPRKTLEDLKTRWNTGGQAPAAHELSWYDIPAQWVIVALGVGVGIYLFGLVAVVKSTRYTWNPATEQLTLPSGAVLTPADIEIFDKRKWDKFLVYLKVKPSHPQLGGREIVLDLLRYSPLEEWILAMERTAFPESVEAEDSGSPAPESTGT